MAPFERQNPSIHRLALLPRDVQTCHSAVRLRRSTVYTHTRQKYHQRQIHQVESYDFLVKIYHFNVRPNDLVAVGDEQFVFTNDGYFSSELGNKFEFLLGLKWGSIIYFDGKDAHVLSPTGNGPNGITATKDRKYLIVAYWSEEVIRAFKLAKV